MSGNNTYNPSAGYTPTQSGNYWWYASYGGDGNNVAAASVCGAGMSETVVSATPGLSVAAPGSGYVGTPLAASSITATLSGSSGSNDANPITFTVFGPQASAPTSCTSGGTTVGSATPAGNGTYAASAGFTPTHTGVYWWYVSSPADANNKAATSACPPAVETVVSVLVHNGSTLTDAASDTGSGVGSVVYYYCPSPNFTVLACTSSTPWTQIGTSSGTSPYSVTWNGQPANGSYVVVAVGTDNVLNADANPSAAIPVTVINLGMSPSTLSAATVGTSYSATVTASGGTGPYSYTVSSGTLPPGLGINASSGAISGTPTAGGSFSFTISAADSATPQNVVSQGYTLTVNAPTVGLSPSTLPAGTYGTAYSQTITASGGTSPYTYARTSGTLPPGLTLSTGGTLAGTPTAPGSYTFTVTATDSSTGTGPFTASQSYTVTVTKAVLTVTANPASMTYGAASLPTFSDTITGFVNGDPQSVVTGSASLTTTATHSSPVGSYTITAAQGSLSAANYSFTFVNGTLSITKAVLTVTANPASMTYGAASLPTFSDTITGFVNGDPQSVVTGSASLTTTATHSSPVGSYTITAAQGSLSAANYSFTFVNGTLSINKAALLITAATTTSTYGTAPTVGVASYTTFVNGDTSASLTTQATCTSTATASTAPGSYTNSCSGAADPNYTITYATGTDTEGQASQTVSFTSTAPSSAQVGGATYTASASATSGLTVAITSGTTSVCTVSSNVVSFVAAGTCTLDANQAGNTNFTAAPQSTQSFTVLALTILSVQPSSGRASFQGTGASGSTTVTVTVCNQNAFPCTGSHIVATASDTTPTNPWSTSNTSVALVANTQYWAQATQGSATSAVFPFTYETTEPEPENVTLGNGGTSGKADNGDTTSVTFSEPLDASTICSAWVNDGTIQSISNATIQITRASSSVLSVSAASTCSGNGNFGSATLGAQYDTSFTSALTFINSTISWNPSTDTLTFTLGTQSAGTAATGLTTNHATTYSADSSMADLSGDPVFTSAVNGTSSHF